MPRLEVRCCCDPNILFGTLPVDDVPRPGLRIPVTLRPASYREAGEVLVVVPPRMASLEIARVRDAEGREAFAIKAGELTLEDLRGISGFEEAR